MRKSIMAVLDGEKAYAVSFMEHLNRKNTVPFEVRAFTDPEALLSCLEKRRVEILLVSEEMSGDQRLDSWPIRLKVILTESDESLSGSVSKEQLSWAEDGAGGMEKGTDVRPRICKYQAASSIVREVMELYSGMDHRPGKTADGAFVKPKTKTVGVFSPVGRTMKTSLTITLGRLLSEKKSSILINMEACPGLSRMMGSEGARGISDILYYIRQGEKALLPRILPLVREYRGLSFLPPFESAAELYGMSPEEWHVLLSTLRTESTYEAVLLDLGEIPLLFPEMLEECDVVYMPERGRDRMAAEKTAEFGKMLSSLQGAAVRGKIRRITMPDAVPAAGDWLLSLPYGPVGRIAAECISRDNL